MPPRSWACLLVAGHLPPPAAHALPARPPALLAHPPQAATPSMARPSRTSSTRASSSTTGALSCAAGLLGPGLAGVEARSGGAGAAGRSLGVEGRAAAAAATWPPPLWPLLVAAAAAAGCTLSCAATGPAMTPPRHTTPHRPRRRGLLACANQNEPHTNGSQFFITLDRCDWLEKKNTIFGRVSVQQRAAACSVRAACSVQRAAAAGAAAGAGAGAGCPRARLPAPGGSQAGSCVRLTGGRWPPQVEGDTIYNVTNLAEVDVDEDDRPYDPPRILSVEVLWNPFEDIVPRVAPKEERAEEQEEQRWVAEAPASRGRRLAPGCPICVCRGRAGRRMLFCACPPPRLSSSAQRGGVPTAPRTRYMYGLPTPRCTCVRSRGLRARFSTVNWSSGAMDSASDFGHPGGI
jgi:cyclophilin family peptidyl-prolyl cis-trans isomerase